MTSVGKDRKGPIDLTNDFVVTYNCHYDEYKINGELTKSWKSHAYHLGKFKRTKTKRSKKVISKIIKTEQTPQKIHWVFNLDKLPEASRFIQHNDSKESKVPSQKIFVFVHSSAKGNGEVLWTLKRGAFETQLSSGLINEVHLGKLSKKSSRNDQGQGNQHIIL